VLRIPAAKSQARIRSQKLSEWFRPLIASRTAGKAPTDRISEHDRTWLLRQVKRICKLAGVPDVSAHGLRGTHADLSLHADVTALAVSQALGHASTALRHKILYEGNEGRSVERSGWNSSFVASLRGKGRERIQAGEPFRDRTFFCSQCSTQEVHGMISMALSGDRGLPPLPR
jgi:hypothetical protein